MDNVKKYDHTDLIVNFNAANAQIKLLELEEINLPVAAISQLRDVAYHLVKALESNDDNEIKEQIDLAKNHAVRAKYDTYETRITYYLISIKSFIENFNNSSFVLRVLPDYVEILTKVNKIKNSFQENLKIPHDSRHSYYSNIDSDINELKDIHVKFQASMPSIYALIEEREQEKEAQRLKDRIEIRRDFRNISLAFAAFILAALTFHFSGLIS